MKAVAEIQESEPASGSSVRRTKVRYTYDNQNQLKTETRYTYSSNTDTTGSPVTTTYTYDTAGNILSVTSNSATLTYTYGDANWRDLLTAVGGTTISYDGSGNPTNWYNGTTSYSDLTWKNGRQLTQLTTSGKTSKYTYDADGIRSTKDVNGTKHEYRTLNGKVVWEKIGEGTSAKIMVFSYDAQGRPFGFKFSKDNGTKFTNYFYALNQQGDVVKIFRPVAVKDADGNVTGYTEKTYATYTYDAWGKLIGITNSAGTSIINKQTTSTSLANLNPLRYRGYYYDKETGFYYLQSRYYDPATCRFINSDDAALLGANADFASLNLFAYCGNDPVIKKDSGGNFWHIVSGAVIGALAGIATKVAVNAIAGNNLTDGLLTAGIAGAVSGALAASGVGLLGQVVGNAAIGFANNTVDQVIGIATGKQTNGFDVESAFVDTAIGAMSGLAGGAGAGNKSLTKIGLKMQNEQQTH